MFTDEIVQTIENKRKIVSRECDPAVQAVLSILLSDAERQTRKGHTSALVDVLTGVTLRADGSEKDCVAWIVEDVLRGFDPKRGRLEPRVRTMIPTRRRDIRNHDARMLGEQLEPKGSVEDEAGDEMEVQEPHSDPALFGEATLSHADAVAFDDADSMWWGGDPLTYVMRQDARRVYESLSRKAKSALAELRAAHRTVSVESVIAKAGISGIDARRLRDLHDDDDSLRPQRDRGTKSALYRKDSRLRIAPFWRNFLKQRGYPPSVSPGECVRSSLHLLDCPSEGLLKRRCKDAGRRWPDVWQQIPRGYLQDLKDRTRLAYRVVNGAVGKEAFCDRENPKAWQWQLDGSGCYKATERYFALEHAYDSERKTLLHERATAWLYIGSSESLVESNDNFRDSMFPLCKDFRVGKRIRIPV